VPLVVAAAVLALPAAAGAATVSGTAFEDFNDNGVRNSAPQVDRGVGGITVTAYGPGGAVLARGTTAADGSYSLNVPDPAARVRLEFTGLPAGYQPARHGARSGTTVQFVDLAGGDASGVDVGVLQPANFCQDNPEIAIACAQYGASTGEFAGEAAIRIVPDTVPNGTLPDRRGPGATVPGQITGATFGQIGTVFGVAQPTASEYLYSAAYTKRHAGYGPGGPGAIYRTDIAQAQGGTPNGEVFFDVNTLASRPAGDPVRGTDGWIRDSSAFDAVGRSGLGNLSSNADGSTLFTVGLATKELIAVPVPADGSRPTSAQTFPIPSPCAVPGDGQPTGTGFNIRNGLVYVGGVCTEASRGNPPPQRASGDLRLYVYTFNPATGAFSSAPVLNESLDPERLCVYRQTATNPFPGTVCHPTEDARLGADWHPWTSQHPTDVNSAITSYPQPLLSDIEFVGDDLVLGVRDRYADQASQASESPLGAVEGGVGAGYTLRACVTGSTYALESGARCGGLDNSADGAHFDYGPGDGLFYWDQWHGAHDYTSNGGILSIPGSPELRQTGYDTIQMGPLTSGGVLYMDKDSGERTKAYHLYEGIGTSPGGVPDTFGKSNGLGDLEALCDAAPIEIGNYVWLDPDKDGVQDPDETPIGGVTVELLDASGNVIATTTTDAAGQYYFNESNVPGGVQPHTDYTVRIPLAQAPLTEYTPTVHDADADLRDSDGIPSGAYVIDRLRTGAAGHNDHTHDFGFNPPFNVSIRKAVSSPTAKIGDTITYTLTARNDGPAYATDVVVTDALPDQLQLSGARTSQGTCTTAGNTVRCALGTLRPGQVETVTVTAVAHRPGTAINNAEIRSPGDRDPSDNRDRREVRIPTPDLSIVKTASDETVKLGETVTYTLTARNKGPGLARDVFVTDNLPEQLNLINVRTPVGTCTSRGDRVRCELGTLSEGQQVRITITARAVRAGRTVNVGVVDVPPPPPETPRDPTPRDNRDTARVVVRRVTLGLTKTVSRRVLRAGQRTTFTIRVRNPGRVTLRNVRTCDDLPAGLAFVKATPKAKLTKGRYCWTAKTLKPRQSKTYRITVRALNGASGTKVNHAVATARDAGTRRAKRAVRIIGGAVSPAGGVTG
jgi:uncharacterized repeat protein (TIGR01451 family)